MPRDAEDETGNSNSCPFTSPWFYWCMGLILLGLLCWYTWGPKSSPVSQARNQLKALEQAYRHNCAENSLESFVPGCTLNAQCQPVVAAHKQTCSSLQSVLSQQRELITTLQKYAAGR